MAEIFLTFDKKENVFKVQVLGEFTEENVSITDAMHDGNEVYVQLEKEQIIPLIKLLVANL